MPNQAHLNSTGRIDTMSVRPRAFLSMWCPERGIVMGQCKNCGNKGFFLSISGLGLCDSCHPPIAVDINQRMGIINESMNLIQSSNVLKTQTHRLELLKKNLDALYKYEKKGITRGITKLLSMYDMLREETILKSVKAIMDAAIAKATAAPSAKLSVTAASKALEAITSGLQELPDNEVLLDYMHDINKYIDDAKLKSILDAANLAEFKDKTNRAIDLYKEALFFLNGIEEKDQWQLEQIAEIETRIKELSQ